MAALNFPSAPTNNQKWIDPNGQTWVYESATNSWTAEGAPVPGMVYRGGLDVTAAAPTGAQRGWVFTVTKGGTPDPSFTGLTGNIPTHTQIIFDGANWQVQSPPGVWTRSGTVVSPSNAGDDIATTGHIAAGTTTPTARLDLVGLSTTPLIAARAADSDGNADIVLTSAGTIGNSRIRFADTAGVAGSILYSHSTDSIQLNADGSTNPMLSVDSTGKMLLGPLATPAVSLDPGTTGSPLVRDSQGRLLVGTSSARSNTPLGGSPAALVERAADSFGNADLMLVNNSASGYYPKLIFGLSQSSSIGSNTLVGASEALGYIQFTGNDGSSFIEAARIAAITDGTPGANDMPGRLVFSTTIDGGSSPTARALIDNRGRFRVFSASENFLVRNANAAGTSAEFFVGVHSATAVDSGGTEAIKIYTNGNIQNTNNSYTALSDLKLKENIVDAGSQWDDIKALQVRKYNLKEGQTHTQIGLIAQEVEPISPGLVYESPDRDEDGNDLGTVTKSVNYSVLYMKAVKALQEAMERIETLEAGNADLLARVAALEAL